MAQTEEKFYFVPNRLRKWEDLNVLNRKLNPDPKLGVGFIPVYLTRKECKDSNPEYKVTVYKISKNE